MFTIDMRNQQLWSRQYECILFLGFSFTKEHIKYLQAFRLAVCICIYTCNEYMNNLDLSSSSAETDMDDNYPAGSRTPFGTPPQRYIVQCMCMKLPPHESMYFLACLSSSVDRASASCAGCYGFNLTQIPFSK